MTKRKLTRELILAAQLKTKEVYVPQWGGTVTISEMPVGKRNQMLAGMMGDDGKVKVNPTIELAMFIAGMRDPEFSPDDAAQLQNISGAAVSMLAQEIMALNGMSPDAQDEARGEY